MRNKAGLLLLTVMLLLGTALVGCSNSGTPSASSSPQATGTASPTAAAKPTANQTPVKITVWERLAGKYLTNMKTLVEQFNKENTSNITVELNAIAPNDYTPAVQAAISGGNLPDIFMNGAIPLQQLVQLNLLHDMEDLITPARRGEFVEGTWNEGQTILDGKIYVLPHSEPLYSSLVYYNKELLQKAGYSEQDLSKHLSWDDFIKIAQKSMATTPDTYGFVFPGTAGWNTGIYYQQMATVTSPEAVSINEEYLFNYKTGMFANNAPGLVESFEFFKKMKDAGILHPNSMLFNPAEARAPFWAGKVAFILESTEGIQTYPPKIDKYGVIYAPSKDGKPTYRGFQGFFGSGLEVSKNTKHYNEVKIFLNYFLDHYGQMMADSYGPGLPTVKQGQIKSDWDLYNKTVQLNHETWIPIPNPVKKNKYAIDVLTEMSKHTTTTTPLLKLFQGYMTGQIPDLKGALDKQNAEMNQAFMDAIKTISSSGHAVSQQDFIFSDWTPFQPYTK